MSTKRPVTIIYVGYIIPIHSLNSSNRLSEILRAIMAEPMDSRLKDFIRRNLPQLTEETDCNDNFLNRMVAFGVFTLHDKDEIVSILYIEIPY